MKTYFNFLGIPTVRSTIAQVIILPIPFEATTSYGHGTKNGPQAIIKSSHQIELYDPEWGDEIQNLVKIRTERMITGSRKNIAETARRFTSSFLIALGGEHSITPELIKPFQEKYSDLSVLQIDAHTDMRDFYDGSKFSHACAMRRVQENGIKNIVQVGIRNTSKEEQKFLCLENIFWGNEVDIKAVLNKLSSNVYISFDVDALDPSIMPATGTPEPNGLSYPQVIALLQAVTRKKNVAAADFVELAPIRNFYTCDFLVAKLIYKLIGYKFIFQSHGKVY